MTRRHDYAQARQENPWGLTLAEARAMDVYIEVGMQKVAAASLGVTQKCIEMHIGAARRKMGSKGQIQHVLQWDRWRRGQG